MVHNDMLEAREIMFSEINRAWNDICDMLLGVPKIIFWPNTANEEHPSDDVWARCSVMHNREQGNITLADESGKKIWDRNGILTLQIFVPILMQNYYNICENLAVYVRNSFESSKSCVTYRRPSVIEIGKDSGFYNFNFVTNFSYSNVK